jgi:hypothetical protein
MGGAGAAMAVAAPCRGNNVNLDWSRLSAGTTTPALGDLDEA